MIFFLRSMALTSLTLPKKKCNSDSVELSFKGNKRWQLTLELVVTSHLHNVNR